MIIKTTVSYDKWFENLSDNIRLKVNTYISRTASGNFSNCEFVGEGISEIKINYQKGYRVYFIVMQNTAILLLAGGDKKSQEADIKTSKLIKKKLKEKGAF